MSLCGPLWVTCSQWGEGRAVGNLWWDMKMEGVYFSPIERINPLWFILKCTSEIFNFYMIWKFGVQSLVVENSTIPDGMILEIIISLAFSQLNLQSKDWEIFLTSKHSLTQAIKNDEIFRDCKSLYWYY